MSASVLACLCHHDAFSLCKDLGCFVGINKICWKPVVNLYVPSNYIAFRLRIWINFPELLCVFRQVCQKWQIWSESRQKRGEILQIKETKLKFKAFSYPWMDVGIAAFAHCKAKRQNLAFIHGFPRQRSGRGIFWGLRDGWKYRSSTFWGKLMWRYSLILFPLGVWCYGVR